MKTIVSSLLAAVFVLAASPSMAYDPAHVAQLKRTKKCPRCDLQGADLRGANIKGVDFYLVDLRDAHYDPVQEKHLRACGAILHNRV